MIHGIVVFGLVFLALVLGDALQGGIPIQEKAADIRPDSLKALREYTLKVNLGLGVTGNPAQGTKKYAAGTLVHYIYFLESSPNRLNVTLDGAPAAVNGTIVMNRDHVLSAQPSGFFLLKVVKNAGVNGTPNSGTMKCLSGTTVNYSYTAAAGYGGLQIKLDEAAVSANGSITMNANHVLTASATATVMYTLNVGTGGISYHGDTTPGVDGVCNATGTPACGTHRIAAGTVVSFSYQKKWPRPDYGDESIFLCPLTCPAGEIPWEQSGHVSLDITDNGDSWVGSFVMTKDCALYVVRYRSE